MFIRKICYLTRLMERQWYKKEYFEKLQNKKLRKIIDYSYRNIRLYKTIMAQARIKPTDIKSINDLQKIPFITKEDIKKNFPEGVISKKFKKRSLITRTTSGSTGEPLSVMFDNACWDYTQAFFARSLFASGLRLRDKIAFFWYEPSKEKGFYQSLGILRKEEIIYTQHEDKQLNKIVMTKPDIICGPPTVLNVLAELIDQKGIKTINPRIVLTFGEVFTKRMRKKIENSFSAEVFDQYASTEFNWIGFECKEHKGFHINMEGTILQSAQDDSIKKRNTLLITSLNNFAMPFINYKTGDIGVFEDSPCDCGRGLILLKSLEGRQDDFIILPSGRVISPRMIGGYFERIKGLPKYKILQKRKDYIKVLLESAQPVDRSKEEIIKKSLGNILKEDIKIDIQCVDKIKTKRGKLRVIESDIKL